ncbi:SDR family oxidoreductase [Pseudonocardia xinjiangensis]
MNDLSGKVALVTGGSRGIGAEIARTLARNGAAVGLTYLGAADHADGVAKDIQADGGRALPIQADNADPEAVRAAVEATVAEFGGFDILVNNAGVFPSGPLDEVTLEDVDRILGIHVRAVFAAAQTAARHMSDGGRIINIGSCLIERLPGPGMTLYALSKSALTGLTKGLARDLGPRGITAVVVDPGPTET